MPASATGAGDHVAGQPAAFPEHLAGGQVVAADFAGGGHHGLGFAVALDDQRGGPGSALLARLLPERLAGVLVQRDDAGAVLVVAVDDEGVPVKRGRAAFAEAHRHAHLAQVLVPERLAVQVIAIQAARAEVGVKMFAIGEARGRGEAALALAIAFMRNLLTRHLLPKHFAGLTVQAQNGELIDFRRLGAGAEAASAFLPPCRPVRPVPSGAVHRRSRGGRWRLLAGLGGFRLDLLAGGDRGLDEDPVVPDDGRGVAAAGNLHLPFDVVGLAPGGGRIGCRRDAVLQRAAPLGPVLVRRRGRHSRSGKGEGAGQAEKDWAVRSLNSSFHISSQMP